MYHHIRKHLEKVTVNEYWRIFILRTIGNFLLFTSIFFIGKTFYNPLKEELRYFVESHSSKKYLVAGDFNINTQTGKISKGFLAKTFNIKPIEVLVPNDINFDIIIPKIGANAKITPNVDPANEDEYLAVLKNGVAHAKGSNLPGEGGHIFLFAHSTDYFWNVGTYNAVFYLLYKLEKGDEVDLFYQGQRYVYRVIGSEVVDPTQVQYLTRKTNREFLTLQTCWPLGTTLKRLLIFAVRAVE